MKRSKKIELILISAALASCNRNISPSGNYDYDWVYETGYPYKTIVRDSTNYWRRSLPWEYYNYWYYAGSSTRINNINLTLKGPVNRNINFVFRGGWGSHGYVSS